MRNCAMKDNRIAVSIKLCGINKFPFTMALCLSPKP